MNAFDQLDRFDRLDRRISDGIEDLAAARPPDYLDDIFQRTARTSQRPRWSFIERWLPVDTVAQRPAVFGRLRGQPILILLIVAAVLAAAAVAYVGSQRRPAPFGPAANGSIAYMSNGQIYVRDTLGGTPHLLAAGGTGQGFPSYSPDGRLVSYTVTSGAFDHFMVAAADGSNPRDVAQIPRSGNSQAAWSPDSGTIALIYDVRGFPQLSLVASTGSSTKIVDLGGVIPLDVSWRPPDGADLLVRAQRTDSKVDLYVVNVATRSIRPLGLPSPLIFGRDYDNSGGVWSLDGSRIAYNRVEHSVLPGVDHFRVHAMNADGTGDIALPGPSDPKVNQAWPAFSPDGRTILVNQWTWKQDSSGGEGWLGVMPADGSAAARPIGPSFAGGEDTGLSKLWSPDGTYVFARVDNTSTIVRIDAASGTSEVIDWTTELPDVQRVAP